MKEPKRVRKFIQRITYRQNRNANNKSHNNHGKPLPRRKMRKPH